MRKQKHPLIPAALLLCTSLALTACSGGAGGGETTGNNTPDLTTEALTETTTVSLTPELPELNYDGASFTLLRYDDVAGYTSLYLAESENGDAFNDALFARERAVEEALGISIGESVVKLREIHPTLSKSVLAGEDAYQLVIPHCIGGVGTMVTDKLLLDWNEIPYVDFDKPYWNSAANEAMSFVGKQPYVVGDLILTDPSAFMFNKDMINSLSLEDPYAIVRAGKWTWDKLTEMASGVTADVDGDGKFTNADRYGFVAQLEYEFDGILHACGQNVVEKDENGVPHIVVNNEKTVNIVTKIYHLLYETNSSFTYKNLSDPRTGFDFATGRALFYMFKLALMGPYRDTEVDFGIVPFPKYDEAQEGYYSLTWSGLICAPITADPELSGAAAELLNYESLSRVRPAYYDVTLNGKLTRDEESAEMLELIFDGTVYDFGLNYSNFGKALYLVYYMMSEKSTDVASFYEKNLVKEEQYYLDLYEAAKD